MLKRQLMRVDAIISSLGLERDSFRGNYLAITASMQGVSDVEEESTWAGVYLTDIPKSIDKSK